MDTTTQRVGALEENLSGMMGQIFALNVAVGSLLAAHHDRKAAAALMYERYEEAFSIALSHAVPDAFLRGMALAKSQFLLEDQSAASPPRASRRIAGATNG